MFHAAIALLSQAVGLTLTGAPIVSDDQDYSDVEATMELLPLEEFPLATEIVWSDPPNRFIDARQDTDENGQPDGFTTIVVRFDRPVALRLENVEVFGTSDELPTVDSVVGVEADWAIMLDGPIPTGETTGVAFAGGVAALIYGAHPGDVNRDGATDKADVSHLADAVALGSLDITRYDFDRNGVLDMQDVDHLREALETAGIEGVWPEGSGLRYKDYSCCCGPLGDCNIFIGTLCSGIPVHCPCVPNPCD